VLAIIRWVGVSLRSNRSSRGLTVSSEGRLHDAADSAKPRAIVTTSWDDGHRLDSRLAELLAEYQLPGTLYISPRDAEFERSDLLADSEIANLAESFEIGAHTLTHPRLPKLDGDAAQKEITDSKAYLEDIAGCAVNSFCYPYGLFTSDHVQIVHNAGFSYARTVQRFSTSTGYNPLRAPTTVHAYSHLVDIPQAITYGKLNPLMAWDVYSHWDRLAERLFDEVLAEGGVFHLWGHSWEIDRNKDWAALRRVFDYISGRSEVAYLVNGDLRSGAVT
jgi:peptidoglycan/xylan/chitin deacetylase (PgdA/CDA1 family)